MTQVVDIRDDPLSAVRTATEVLASGGVVVMPTDTVYGVGSSATDAAALDRIFELKDRPRETAIPVLVADIDQAREIATFDPASAAAAAAYWPGPLTLVVTSRGVVAAGADDTVGVRCPDDDFVRVVAAAVGPLAVSSANRHGQQPAVEAAAAAAGLAGPVDLVVERGPCDGRSSTVASMGPPLVIIRAGQVTRHQLERAVGPDMGRPS